MLLDACSKPYYTSFFINRCAETELNETVSQLLCALLKRLTDLERHEQYLRSCQTGNDGEMSDQVMILGHF